MVDEPELTEQTQVIEASSALDDAIIEKLDMLIPAS